MLVFFVSCHGFVYGQEKNVSVITIEGADFTEYKKNKETNTEEIILTGNVTISVKKDSKTSRVSADKVTYNRSTQMMYAVGNVSLVQTDSSEGEQRITATTLLLNTSTLEGIFDKGDGSLQLIVGQGHFVAGWNVKLAHEKINPLR